jgi:hypothetical protein
MKLWIVCAKDDEPVFMSVHSTEEKAREAVIRYTKSEYWGGKETDYIINPQSLDDVID